MSDWVHKMVRQNKMLQSILYGVQNPSDQPGLFSKLRGDSAKLKGEEVGK